MASDFTICVGTVGAGVWFSPDGGDHWRRCDADGDRMGSTTV
jgi:hypothetical protein